MQNCRLRSSQSNSKKPNDYNFDGKNKILWSTIAPKVIDLSKEFSRENKLDDIIREKHSTKGPTNFTLIIETTDNSANIVEQDEKVIQAKESSKLSNEDRDNKRYIGRFKRPVKWIQHNSMMHKWIYEFLD